MGSITDYLTCGQCLKEFPLQKITQFIQHKKLDCDDDVEDKIEDPELQCNYCPQGFMTAWGLLIHAQISHNLKIFLEKASKSLFKDNRLYSVKTDINTTALPFSSSEEVLPFKAIAESIDDVSKESTVDTRLISSNLLHIPIPSVNIMQKSSMLKTANSTSSRFGSNIVVTRDLLSDKSSGNGLTLVPSMNQSENICPLNIINEPRGNSSLKISPVKIVESFSSGTSPNDLSTMLHDIGNTEVFQKARPEVKDNDKGDTMEVNKEETIVKPKKMMEVEKSKTDVVGCPENTESEDKCIDGETELDEGSECCDIQGCGVTVIPGTHQDLQKCCNAVVPKKRKRHMEMKHMPFSWSSSRYARRRMYRNLSNVKPMSSTNLAKQAASSIYIEVESEPPDKQARSNNNNNNSIDFDNQSPEDTDMQTDSNVTMSQVKASEMQVKTLSSAEMKPRSLILKPGAIFSIPFTYTIPTSSSISTLQINPSVTMKTEAQGSPVLATTLNQNDLPEGPSSQDNEKENGAQSTETRKGQKSNKDLDFSPKKYATSKPFHCEICPMAFNQRIHLKKHIMSKHTGNKPFKCGECDYSTVERSHLKVHIRIHTGEKPFKCTYCEYATAQNSTLKIHLKRHHGGKMFHCISCEKEFTQERQLKGHECENAVVINPERKTTTQVSSSTSVQLKPTTTVPEPSMQSLQGDNSAEKDSQSVEQITSLVASPIQKPGSVDMVGQNTAPE